MKKILLYLTAALSLLAFCACEQLIMDDQTIGAPVVTSFSPKTAPVGAIIDVSGENLHNVTKAFIGDVQVEIARKISDKNLTVKITSDVTSGKIRLESPEGEGASAEDFQCSFAVPEIIASALPESAELGETILIAGKNLNSAKSVIFTAEGMDEGYPATIVTQNDDEIVAKVPYVEKEDAVVTLVYYDGENEVETPEADAPKMKVIRKVPVFKAYDFERTAVGRSLTLEGENLNNVERITVGEFDAQISSKSLESITFTVPAGDFADGETTVKLVAHYFAGNENTSLTESFIVYVPFLKYWENIVTECQSQDAEKGLFASFFSPENGKVYPNGTWATELDPLAMKLQGTQFQEANVFKPGTVTDEEYASVPPYFFFSVSGGKDLQINSPANSNGQLKNFSNDSNINSQNRVPGNNKSTACGTPIMTFRCLDKNNATEAALIEKVVNGTLENINEELFPIDPSNFTIGGIGYTSAAGGLKHTSTPKWPEIVTPPAGTDMTQDLKDADVVLLCAYYTNNGYNKDNKVQNIKRLGLIHITKVDWIVSANDFRGTQVTYNCYWQKYDYDYSKLK